MNLKKFRQQVIRSKNATLFEIEWLKEEDASDEYYFITHNKGHLHVLDTVLTFIDAKIPIKKIKKYLKCNKDQHKQFIRNRDIEYDKTNNDSLFDDRYFFSDGIVCECKYLLSIINEKKYYRKKWDNIEMKCENEKKDSFIR